MIGVATFVAVSSVALIAAAFLALSSLERRTREIEEETRNFLSSRQAEEPPKKGVRK